MELTKEEFDEWAEHPTTKKIIGAIRVLRTDYVEVLASGKTFVKDSTDQTAMRTAEIVGKIAGLDELLNLDQE